MSDSIEGSLEIKKEKARAASRRWKERNPEKAKLSTQNARIKSPEKHRISNQNDYFKNRDRHKERYASQTMRYSASKLQATPSWADLSKIKEFYITADGLQMLTGEYFHVDHIVPLRSLLVCGLHTPDNLQILPRTDNLTKGN
jgi:hypothetical protein